MSRNKKHSYEPDMEQNMSPCAKKTFEKEKKHLLLQTKETGNNLCTKTQNLLNVLL